MNKKDRLIQSLFKAEDITLGEDVFSVREMDTKQSTAYEGSLIKVVGGKPEYDLKEAKSKMVQLCLFDKDGKKVFEKGDIPLIEAMPKSVVEKIFDIATKINAIDKTVTEKN